MYILGILLFVLSLAFISLASGGSPLAFIDIPSLIVILGVCIPILLASGLAKDFIRGFKVMQRLPNQLTEIELKRTLIAISLVMKSTIIGGLLGTLVGSVAIGANIDSITKLGPSIGVALLTILYAVVFYVMLLPVQYRVKAVLSTFPSHKG